jgi:hypothetical protein
MKSSFIATAVLAFAALGSVNAFAATQQNGEAAAAVSFTPSTSLVTRAEVQADFLNARSAGALSVSNEGAFAPVAQTDSSVSREQIRIEAVMAAHDTGDHSL